MASITIRNIDDGLKRKLRIRAAEHGRSMEEEVRQILQESIERPRPAVRDLGRAVHARFAELGGVDLEPPERRPMRPAPEFK